MTYCTYDTGDSAVLIMLWLKQTAFLFLSLAQMITVWLFVKRTSVKTQKFKRLPNCNRVRCNFASRAARVLNHVIYEEECSIIPQPGDVHSSPQVVQRK